MTTKILAISGRSISAASNASLGIAGGMMVSPITYGFAAILLAAQTATDYHKVKKGQMTKKEFKKRLKYNGVGAGAGILGASAGAATGFLIGSAILPGIGTGIGVLTGAIFGGVMGQKLSHKALKKMDDKILTARIEKMKVKIAED